MTIKFAHIVARSINGVIGNNGDIPWKISRDLNFFKEKTTNNICIVGRKTYDGIKHLKNRTFIVISRQNYENTDNAYFVNGVEEAIEKSKEIFDAKIMCCVYIIGGAEIYKETFKYVSFLYITEIEKSFDGDAFYSFEHEKFKLIESSNVHSENKTLFYFTKYKCN